MEDTDQIETVKRAVFGKQVEQFFSSEIGRYLMQRADVRFGNALVALKDCDPEDVKTIRVLQNEAQNAENFKNWLADAVTDGLQALGILEDGQ